MPPPPLHKEKESCLRNFLGRHEVMMPCHIYVMYVLYKYVRRRHRKKKGIPPEWTSVCLVCVFVMLCVYVYKKGGRGVRWTCDLLWQKTRI